MHELSVCLALLDQVERVARERGSGSVERIVLRLGPLSGVEPKLLENAWPLASTGTIAEAAELEILPSGLRVHCTTCGAETDARPNRLLCGDCGDFRTRIVSGDDLLLERVVLERKAPHPDNAADGNLERHPD